MFSCSIPPLFVLSHHVPMVNTTSNWLCFGPFLSPPVPSLRIHWPLTTDYWPVFSCHWPLFSRHSPLPPKTLPRWLLPATERRNCERSNGPDLAERTLYLIMHRNRRFLRRIQSVPPHSPPPDQLIILSWPEALNASGSKRACRMVISRNACSLVALPHFPELAQAVRYGVTGISAKLLPTWVEAVPIEVDRCHEPNSVLVIATSSVPDHAWNEVILALQWIGWTTPTCGS